MNDRVGAAAGAQHGAGDPDAIDIRRTHLHFLFKNRQTVALRLPELIGRYRSRYESASPAFL